MDAHCAIEIFELQMLKRTDFDNAGVVDKDVDLAETLKCLLNGGLNLSGLEQVALDRQDFRAEVVEIGFSAGEFVRIACEERDFATASANAARDLQTETARTAGDKRDFVPIK